ncbi:hypothetical protein BU24DRAFT_197646 [Aaosphaeria arxii CBS 175.79]|uniref:Uncharacterized protein n=1 Tax=Aaosphaeria arxii CBS 175.79 TaxID=1450172 RepID=A0A6A5XVH9_9PLEO|nr:uncharacterized protein BU24DRAFT_197646 [Aaosphaeria arxii CBS 175.79]KAF2016264.1 hypothetical protein BU24DRAFT_197646 [Aaosphaeria arxii CBS 175.79]
MMGCIANIGRTSGSLRMRCQHIETIEVGDSAASRNERELCASSRLRSPVTLLPSTLSPCTDNNVGASASSLRFHARLKLVKCKRSIHGGHQTSIWPVSYVNNRSGVGQRWVVSNRMLLSFPLPAVRRPSVTAHGVSPSNHGLALYGEAAG